MTLKFLSIICVFFLRSTEALSQETPLFIIVSCSEGVSLDDKPISVGQTLFASSRKLTIPKNGYVGVVADGFAVKITKSFKVERLTDKNNGGLKNNWLDLLGLFFPVTSLDYHPPEIQIIGAPENQYATNYGDSILIAILDRNGFDPPYLLEYRDVYDSIISSEILSHKWTVENIRPLIESKENVIFTLNRSNRKNGSNAFLLRKPSGKAKQKIEFDLSRISQVEVDQLIFRLAIYELNYFYYDKIFTLYTLTKSNYQSKNSLLSNYVSQLKVKYKFQQFDFKH